MREIDREMCKGDEEYVVDAIVEYEQRSRTHLAKLIDGLAQLLSDIENGLDYYHDEQDSCSRLRTICAELELLQEGCGAMVIWRSSRMMEDDMLRLSLEMLIDRVTPSPVHPAKALQQVRLKLDAEQTRVKDIAIASGKDGKYSHAAEMDARAHGLWMAKIIVFDAEAKLK